MHFTFEPRTKPMGLLILVLAACLQSGLGRYLRGSGVTELVCSTSTARVAIINHGTYHHEVVYGLLHVTASLFSRVDLYVHNSVFRNSDPLKARELFNQYPYFKLYGTSNSTAHGDKVDLVVAVSPEYDVELYRNLINKLKPKWVLAMVHNGDKATIPAVAALHHNTSITVMAPHVAEYITAHWSRNETRNPVQWILPSAPARYSVNPCDGDMQYWARRIRRFRRSRLLSSPAMNQPCYSLFAVQGTINTSRRNYTSLMYQLSHQNPLDMEQLGVMVVGKNANSLIDDVSTTSARMFIHNRLPFVDYYSLLQRSRGLLMLLASDKYWGPKTTSTIVTALTVQVPVLMSAEDLSVYSVMTNVTGNTWVIRPGEDDVSAMKRLMALSHEEVLDSRARMRALAGQLNAKAQQLITRVVQCACGTSACHGLVY